ncbi:hypothetical protein QTP88_028679 [Uroleucon formosanum]
MIPSVPSVLAGTSSGVLTDRRIAIRSTSKTVSFDTHQERLISLSRTSAALMTERGYRPAATVCVAEKGSQLLREVT